MAQLRWIQGFLLMILQLTVSADETSVLTRAGEEVTLRCSKVIDGQKKCNGTTWNYAGSGSRAAVELVSLGQTGQNNKTDRLSLTANCSLVIKKVRGLDAGHYYCQQWKHDDKHKNHHQVHESTVDLSVLNMTEQKENQRKTLICSVVTFDPCRYKVKWFHQDVDNNETPPAETDCSATVTLSSGSKLPQCNLTDTVTGEVFTFSLQSSEKLGGKFESTTKPGNKMLETTRPETENVPSTLE
ncbi:hypothetical protein AMECASPLE_039434, partial [Ameca splendens]